MNRTHIGTTFGRRARGSIFLQNRMQGFPERTLPLSQRHLEGRIRNDRGWSRGRSGDPVEINGADKENGNHSEEDRPQPGRTEGTHRGCVWIRIV